MVMGDEVAHAAEEQQAVNEAQTHLEFKHTHTAPAGKV